MKLSFYYFRLYLLLHQAFYLDYVFLQIGEIRGALCAIQ
jgi:hypothetical protein